MILYDLSPIQFWLIDEETANEKVICGIVKQDCFCQPIQCDDTPKIPFSDSDWLEYYIYLYDSDGNLLTTFLTDEVTPGYWISQGLNFNPFCGKQIQAFIKGRQISNGNFDVDLTNWTNEASYGFFNAGSPVSLTGTVDWAVSAGSANVTTGTGVNDSKILKQIKKHFEVGVEYTFTIVFDVSLFTAQMIFVLSDTVEHSLWIFNGAGSTGEDPASIGAELFSIGSHTVTRTFIPTLATYTELIVQARDGGFATNVKIDSITVTPQSTDLAKSDCLDTKSSQDCTQLIDYYNSSIFDGVDFTTTNFQARFPAIFFEERNPQEQEDMELSNGQIVTIRSTIQQKKLFETGFMQNYMHRKLQKILMCEEVSIDGEFWKKRDSYDDSPVKKYNLKRASVLLTLYNSVEKNTI